MVAFSMRKGDWQEMYAIKVTVKGVCEICARHHSFDVSINLVLSLYIFSPALVIFLFPSQHSDPDDFKLMYKVLVDSGLTKQGALAMVGSFEVLCPSRQLASTAMPSYIAETASTRTMLAGPS